MLRSCSTCTHTHTPSHTHTHTEAGLPRADPSSTLSSINTNRALRFRRQRRLRRFTVPRRLIKCLLQLYFFLSFFLSFSTTIPLVREARVRCSFAPITRSGTTCYHRYFENHKGIARIEYVEEEYCRPYYFVLVDQRPEQQFFRRTDVPGAEQVRKSEE